MAYYTYISFVFQYMNELYLSIIMKIISWADLCMDKLDRRTDIFLFSQGDKLDGVFVFFIHFALIFDILKNERMPTNFCSLPSNSCRIRGDEMPYE